MSEELNPITREEMFLAKAAGQNVPALTPITRVELFLQNLIDHIKSIGSGGGGTGGGGAQPDWNAAEGEPGHVLNRPFYSEFTESVILPECNIEWDEDGSVINTSEIPLFNLTPGNEYTVNWNGVHYKCIATGKQIDGNSVAFIGDIGFVETGTPVTGEPFIIGTLEGNMELAPIDGSTSVTLSIICMVETVHPLPEKYLPQNGMLYGDSNHRLYKTADTSNPDNRLIKSELLDMVNRGMQFWVGLTDNGETVYVPVKSVRITDIAAVVHAEYVNGSTSTVATGYAFNTRYAE